MFIPTKRLRPVAGAALAVVVAAPMVGAFAHPGGHPHALPRTFRQTASAYRKQSSVKLANGVWLNRFASGQGRGRVTSEVLVAKLGQEGVSAGVLAGQVTQKTSVQNWARASRALAAVNGDYFDISASQAPNGTVIRNGHILKGIRTGQSVVGQGRDGAMRTGSVYLSSTITWRNGKSAPVDFFNTVLSRGSLPANGIAVFDSEWGGTPLRLANAPRNISVIAVSSRHKVLSVSHKVTGKQHVPAGGMLVVATGKYAPLSHLGRGAKIGEHIGMRTSAPSQFAWGMGYGLTLMDHSRVVHNWPNNNSPRDARTAVGWSDNGHTLLLVTSEVGKGSAGQTVNEIADELAGQGATDGVLLDGGGSTTLVARAKGHGVQQVGHVSNAGNVQRAVPVGIGIFVTRHAN